MFLIPVHDLWFNKKFALLWCTGIDRVNNVLVSFRIHVSLNLCCNLEALFTGVYDVVVVCF